MSRVVLIFFCLFLGHPLLSFADTPTMSINGAVLRGAHLGGVPRVSADPCDGTPAAGTVCTGGAVYVGTFDPVDGGGVKKYMTTPADAGLYAWAGAFVVTGATSITDGSANTINLAARGSGYAAAYYCDGLSANGYSDWFLPAQDELNLLYANNGAIGGFDVSGSFPVGYYWASTEIDNANAWFQDFSNGTQANATKFFSMSVRCVRKY